MENRPKGHCKHGEFILAEGCPECIAERRAAERTADDQKLNIVTVRYYSQTTGETSGREYTYFSVDPLAVGQVVQVPVRDRVQKAVVTGVNIPEAEIAAFRDSVKTIPSGSVYPEASVPEPVTAEMWNREMDEGAFQEPPQEEGPVTYVNERDNIDLEAALAAEEQKPPALAVIESHVGRPPTGLFQLYQEAAGLLQFAKKRVIATNDDLKPATDDLAVIAKCKKAMFERKNEIVGPFKARLDAVNQAFADLMFPVVEADRLTREKVTVFDNEQRRKAAVAQRIEDDKFKLAQEEAALTGGEHTQELGTAVAPPVAERTRTDLGTLGGRANWKARVLDFSLLPDEYKLPNEPLLNSFARSTKGTRQIPGVEFYNDRVVTMRTK